MKKYVVYFVIIVVLASSSFLVSCGSSNEPKKSVAKEDQDFSSSGMIKDIEEMQKAADGGKTPVPANPAPTQKPATPTVPQK